MLLTIIAFILVLSVLVFVHEMGHFMTARWFGIRAEEFGFGFPPRFAGVYKNNEGKWKFVRGNKEVTDCPGTVYSINFIPLGGFVKIKGEDGDNTESDSFGAKKIWQRTVVLSAGVLMNIVLAAILFSTILMIGSPQAVDGLGKGAEVSERQLQIIQVAENSPAAQAGLQLGDAIVSINGIEFAKFEDLQKYVDENRGKVLDYKIKRGQEIKDLKITPQLDEKLGKGVIGVAMAETGIVKYPWYLAIWQGIKQTGLYTWIIIVAFYELLKGLILGNGVSADVAGPVGIASLTGQVARMGIVYLLQFTALLSINLAIINFIPFPALDGGRVLFLALEKLKGKPVRRELEAVIHNVGFLLLMVLIVIVTFRDILKFGDKLKIIWQGIINLF